MIQKPFFQLVQKDNVLKGVHSQSDLKYMISMGWKPLEAAKATIEDAMFDSQKEELEIPSFVKRGPGRPRKN